MKQGTKTFLFSLGIIVSIMIINAFIVAFVVKSAYLGDSVGLPGLILVTLGKYMWAILPITIFIVMIIRESIAKKKISETQTALKRGSVWAFVVMVGLMLLGYLSSIS